MVKEVICPLCKKKINKNEDYTIIIDYKKGKKAEEYSYHRICFVDSINKRQNVKDMLRNYLERANNLLSKVEGRLDG